MLGRIRRKSREHGPESVRGLWKYAVRCNEELAKKTAAAIARFAEENGADVIVFEYLDMKGRIRGKRKMRLHMWKKRGVQKICAHMAHRKGIRVSRVCAWNTSALAYDGSGDVMRDPDNHSLCTFTNGKRYNCDLSASYKTHAGDGVVRAGGGSPCGTAQKLMRICGPCQAPRSDAGEWVDRVDAGSHSADCLLCGDGRPIGIRS